MLWPAWVFSDSCKSGPTVPDETEETERKAAEHPRGPGWPPWPPGPRRPKVRRLSLAWLRLAQRSRQGHPSLLAGPGLPLGIITRSPKGLKAGHAGTAHAFVLGPLARSHQGPEEAQDDERLQAAPLSARKEASGLFACPFFARLRLGGS